MPRERYTPCTTPPRVVSVTGLREIGWAAGTRVSGSTSTLSPSSPRPCAFCQSLGLDPLGLLASGALVMTLSPDNVAAVTAGLERAAIPVTQIGVVTPAEQGFVMITPEGEREMSDFPIDELARFLSSLPADAPSPQ